MKRDSCLTYALNQIYECTLCHCQWQNIGYPNKLGAAIRSNIYEQRKFEHDVTLEVY